MSKYMKIMQVVKKSLLTAGLVLSAGAASAQTSERLVFSSFFGDGADKRVIAIVGDGFSTAADRRAYKDFVKRQIIEGTFTDGPFKEDLRAFDIIQIDAVSTDSGVTQVDNSGNVTTARNTALDYRFSGTLNRCWMEKGPNTNARTQTILNNANVTPDFLVVVLNDSRFGGCARGNEMAVSMGITWQVVSHELGHSIGGLCDEYRSGTLTAYTGGEPGCVNLTTNTNRSTLKWREFVDPSTALPTTFNSRSMNTTQTVGAFVGGNVSNNSGIWRPTNTGMMNNNSQWSPVHYKRIKEVLEGNRVHSFNDSYTGDFDGDGDDDVVIHNGRSLALYLSDGENLQTADVLSKTHAIRQDIYIYEGSQFYVGDFDGDGKDDLYMYTPEIWFGGGISMLRSNGQGFELADKYHPSMPEDITNHHITQNEQIFVSDFNGDGKDDLIMANPKKRLFHMYTSNGSRLTQKKVYADNLPGAAMSINDQYFVADFNGDGRDDIYLYNGDDWHTSILTMLSSTGNEFSPVKRYTGERLSGWNLKSGGKFYVADFDNDGKDDLYSVKISDENSLWHDVGKLRSTGTGLTVQKVWERSLGDRVNRGGTWFLLGSEEFHVADVNGDGLEDLYMYEPTFWWTSNLTSFISSRDGGLLRSTLHTGTIGRFNLTENDRIMVGDFSGDGRDDVFAFRDDWFALLRSDEGKLTESARHFKWIYDAEYHRDGLW